MAEVRDALYPGHLEKFGKPLIMTQYRSYGEATRNQIPQTREVPAQLRLQPSTYDQGSSLMKILREEFSSHSGEMYDKMKTKHIKKSKRDSDP